MKTQSIISVLLLSFAASISAQDAWQTAAPLQKTSRGLGDLLWSMDVEKITGSPFILAVEFDGSNYWVSGTKKNEVHLFKISPQGKLLNEYGQGIINPFGYKDMAWDGQYFYAGALNNPGYVIQIDPISGTPTGVHIGPFPIIPVRALAFDQTTGSFWTASYSSNIYKYGGTGGSKVYMNWGLQGISGMAVEESTSNPMLWIWSQDGNGCLASEFDILQGKPTGKTFDGDLGIGGIAAGACAYDNGGGEWELVGMHQASHDTIAAYDLSTVKLPLMVDVEEIKAHLGGTANFSLYAGVAHANRFYGLFGGTSGSQPGIPLPGGMATLPINWDWFSTVLVVYGFGFGSLDANGDAMESLVFPGHLPVPSDLNMTFAYCLQGPPWDFASNPVEILLKAPEPPPPEFSYDDGSSENLLGWTNGGELCWMHYFECDTVATILSLSSAFGCSLYPGYAPPNGSPCTFYIWEDPSDDANPWDAVLLDSVSTVVENVDTDLFKKVSLNAPVTVKGGFWVGCCQDHAPGQFVSPIDMDTTSHGTHAWVVGTPGWPFDPHIPNNTEVFTLSSTGLDSCFLLRAQTQ